jgi:hypothetical protein
VWLGWGVGVGLVLGTLAVTPAPPNRANGAGPALVARNQVLGSRVEAGGPFAPTSPPTSLPTTSNLPVVPPPTEGEAGGTSAPVATDASAAAVSPAQSERADEDELAAGVGVNGDEAEPLDELADLYVGDGGDPTLPATEADAAAAPPPAQSALTLGTIRDPLRSNGWALRAAPSTSARILASLPTRTRVQILPDTATGGGFSWVHVRTQAGAIGWVVAYALLR